MAFYFAKVLIHFLRYSSVSPDPSGAYLFSPKGHATFHFSPVDEYPLRLIKGPLSCEIHAHYPNIFHRYLTSFTTNLASCDILRMNFGF